MKTQAIGDIRLSSVADESRQGRVEKNCGLKSGEAAYDLADLSSFGLIQ